MSTGSTHSGRRAAPFDAARGFSMVEVMVALIVLSVGLLGVARLQSLALSSTSVANKRSLAAIEAEGLAAAMHENRGYWTGGDPANGTITLQGTTVTFTAGFPNLGAAGTPTCTSTVTPCTPTQVAAHDLNAWAVALQALLPTDNAIIACGTLSPVSCTITISWAENAVAINAQEATSEAAAQSTAQNPTYTLYVEP